MVPNIKQQNAYFQLSILLKDKNKSHKPNNSVTAHSAIVKLIYRWTFALN